MLNPSAVLARGRAAALALMVDTCTIRRYGPDVTSTTDGSVTRAPTVLYTGPCRIQQADAEAVAEDTGEAYLHLLRVIVQLPITVTGLRVLDEVTCDTSAHDADLPGRVFLVRDLAHKTHVTARRVRAEERT